MNNFIVEERARELQHLLILDPDWLANYGDLLHDNTFILSNEYEELIKLLTEINARKCREDVNRFLSYVMLDPQTGNPITQAPIHLEMQALLDKYDRMVILFPREHGKTTQLIGRCVWEIGNNHDHRIKIVCASDSLAVKRITAIREMIGHNDRVKKIFPKLVAHKSEDTWSKSRLTVSRKVSSPDPTIEGAGIMSSATGGRCSILILDDPVDIKNAIQQPAMRPQVKTAFRDVWLNLLFKDGKVWYIATPWHEDDLTMNLKKDKQVWHTMEYAIDDNYTPVWEEQWNTERLKSKEKEITARPFARGFKLLPISDEEMTFPDYDKAKHFNLDVNDCLELSENGYNYMGVDLAISKRSDSAYTVLFCTRVGTDNVRYPVEIIRGKFGSITTAVLVLAYGTKWDMDVIKIENNAYQDSLLEWVAMLQEGMLEPVKDIIVEMGGIKRILENESAVREMHLKIDKHLEKIKEKIYKDLNQEQWNVVMEYLPIAAVSSLPIQPHITGISKADELLGLPNLSAEISNGDWVIPMKGHELDNPDHVLEDCEWCTWLDEMRFHPHARNSDTVMAMWMSREALRSGSGTVRMI